ncbi:MAG: glycosyl transferase [Verrucomicrobiales bacterium]|nr:glycosyl transferase [Verrucomicrobiales bacterium]
MGMRERQEEMMARLLAANTTSGRLALGTGLWSRRMAWKTALAGAHMVKRTVDILGSAALILALSPVFICIALCIKFEDSGPIFFAQTRVGKYGRLFKMFKFRSMCLDAEAKLAELLSKNQHLKGVTFKIKDDPRITRVGKWIRALSLDELPQLFNVLGGEMSLVGPRPPVPREVALYSMQDRRRLEALPGITCFWQVGGRAEIDFPQQVELDVMYIERQSLWTDVKILLKTIPAVVNRKGAY